MGRFRVVMLIIIITALTGCKEIEVEDIEIIIPELPCFDGWQYDFIGQPMINPDTGAQLQCDLP